MTNKGRRTTSASKAAGQYRGQKERKLQLGENPAGQYRASAKPQKLPKRTK